MREIEGYPEGNAIVYCEGAFGTTYGKTAHGLVRRTRRYRVLSVIDSSLRGKDAGEIVDGVPNGVPLVGSTAAAIEAAREVGTPATHFVVGIATDGGVLTASCRAAVLTAIRAGLNIDSGLHEFLNDDRDLVDAATEAGVTVRDIRYPPPRNELHFFSGTIEEVDALTVAILGTDSAVGKRTTCWLLVDALEESGYSTELIGTGQTSWMQGVEYGILLDSLVNDFVAGEIEHVVYRAWNERRPDVILIEGQGSLMNPAYPGGFEILAASRPDIVILQHPPARREYDGFPGYPLHPLDVQIGAVELIGGMPVAAITVNHEGLDRAAVPGTCAAITGLTGLPAVDVLVDGADALVDAIAPYLRRERKGVRA